MSGGFQADLLDVRCSSFGSRQKKSAAKGNQTDAAPNRVSELRFDGNPGKPSFVSFAVRVFPETEAVLVYLSREAPRPIRCEGPLTRFTILTDSGRIFVERLSAKSNFEITIIASAEL